ncbi:hypothetical protein HMPREF0080_02085 [Anaeroglobus geminatus F0357]|uniref:Uncharacterized protein n=1 Tax=Anaeroglobus geminatus F0357 TaxID=861450 RepID=G9YK74_9FIRM|nr:hypothetical protein HMPREF0080_02085 [Anaeroglobus geminatus F0357]
MAKNTPWASTVEKLQTPADARRSQDCKYLFIHNILLTDEKNIN